jgi:Flp pilus assembly protein TadD
MQAGMPEKAVGVLSDWLRQTPDDTKTRHVLASSYLGMKRYDDAIQQYLALSEENADNPVVLNNLAWLYQQKEDTRAIEFAERAYALAPKSAAIVDTLGWILVDNGQYARALELLRKATVLAPQESEIRYHLAVALHRAGRSDDARRELQEILRLGKDFASAVEARDLLRSLSQ